MSVKMYLFKCKHCGRQFRTIFNPDAKVTFPCRNGFQHRWQKIG